MRSFSAKLLLFGEYVLLNGAAALSLPASVYSGQWRPMGESPCKVLPDPRYYKHAGLRTANIDVPAFEHAGLCFDSDIPSGYGLGSSGAYVAAIYDRFCLKKASEPSLLRHDFAQMESYFHGRSSGLDPLTSYLNKPILFEKDQVQVLDNEHGPKEVIVFLLDSNKSRETAPLVNWFQDYNQSDGFRDDLANTWLPANSDCIHAWINGRDNDLWDALGRLSRFQLEKLPPMIPEVHQAIWKESLESDRIRFKICGAGGGGFTLGFARNKKALKDFAKNHSLVFPFANPSSV